MAEIGEAHSTEVLALAPPAESRTLAIQLVRKSFHRSVTRGEVAMKSPNEGLKRGLSSILVSSTFHGVLLACILLLGIASQQKFSQPAQTQTIAQIAISGGSHRVKIHLPPMDTAAHTREPAPTAESAARTRIPMQAPPLKVSGGGVPPKPHAGDGSGKAMTGNGSDAQDI